AALAGSASRARSEHVPIARGHPARGGEASRRVRGEGWAIGVQPLARPVQPEGEGHGRAAQVIEDLWPATLALSTIRCYEARPAGCVPNRIAMASDLADWTAPGSVDG